MSDPLKVVIGYDRNEVAAAHTLANSLIRHSSRPLAITYLYLPQLEADNLLTRKDRGSTDFSYSRFLAPYMAGYKGKVLFMDCDIVVKADVAELFDDMPLDKCVGVVKHEYKPTERKKFLGNDNPVYPKKLWSSVMMFNCSSQKVKNLTPKVVNEAPGSYLHQFMWTHESRIHAFDEAWNWVPEHSDKRISVEDAKAVHYTLGTPLFKNYKDCPYSNVWWEEYKQMSEVLSK